MIHSLIKDIESGAAEKDPETLPSLKDSTP